MNLTPSLLCTYMVHYLLHEGNDCEWFKSLAKITTWTGFQGERYFGAETTLANGAKVSVTVPAEFGQTEMIAIEALRQAVSTESDTALQLVSMEWK